MTMTNLGLSSVYVLYVFYIALGKIKYYKIVYKGSNTTLSNGQGACCIHVPEKGFCFVFN